MMLKTYYGVLVCDFTCGFYQFKKGSLFEFIIETERKISRRVFYIKDKDTKFCIPNDGESWNMENFNMIDESKKLYRLIN